MRRRFEQERRKEVEEEKTYFINPEKVEKLAEFINPIICRVGRELNELHPDLPIFQGYPRLRVEEYKSIIPEHQFRKDLKLAYEMRKERSPLSIQETKKGEIKVKRENKLGFLGEELLTTIWWKFLRRTEGKENFIIVLCAEPDDEKGIDNLIVSPKEGILCSSDDTTVPVSSERFREKSKQIIARNIREKGVQIRYGIKFKDNKINKTRLEGVPEFYWVVHPDLVLRTPRFLDPNLDNIGPYEAEILDAICGSSLYQAMRIQEALQKEKARVEDQKTQEFLERIQKAYQFFAKFQKMAHEFS